MKEGGNLIHSPEQEPDKEREKFCLYCYDFYPEEAIRTVATIDGKDEPVCADHAWILDELGLVANGKSEGDIELVDAIRDRIMDFTRLAFEFRSVKDLENGL